MNLKKFLIFCSLWNSVRFLLTREVHLIPECVCECGVCVCVCEGGGGVCVCVWGERLCVCDCEARYTFCETDYLSQSHELL